MNGLAYVGSAILFFVPSNVFNDVAFTKAKIVCMNVNNRLDAFVFVMAA
jgi:hypothetical protein